MSDKNPRNPDDSPIRTEHSGSWDPTQYRNYVKSPAQPQRGLKAFVYGRDNGTVYSSPEEYTRSKSEDAQIDKRLEQAINQDLAQRNIPKTKSKRNKTNY